MPSKLGDGVVDHGWTQWRNLLSGGHQSGNFGRVKCFKCGRFGHVENLCIEKGCFPCDKFDHVVKNCKKVGGECYNCDCHGHLKMYCPLRLKKCFGCGIVGHLKRDCNVAVADDKSLRVRRMFLTSGNRQGKGLLSRGWQLLY